MHHIFRLTDENKREIETRLDLEKTLQSAVVEESTQTSVNVVQELETWSSAQLPSTFVASICTDLHSQRQRELHHAFVVTSCLRYAVLKLVNKKITIIDKIKAKLKRSILLDDDTFHKMMVLWIGNICPRSFAELVKEDSTDNILLTAVQRLTWRTAFEIAGWKRILPIRDIFAECKLDIDKYELEYQEIKSQSFQVCYY